jgi:hypothetical protein
VNFDAPVFSTKQATQRAGAIANSDGTKDRSVDVWMRQRLFLSDLIGWDV